MSDRWNELYVELTAAEAGRIEAERREKRTKETLEDLLRWSRATSRLLLEEASKIARQRAKELGARSGIGVETYGPDWSTLRHPSDPVDCPSAEVGSLRLKSPNDEVVLYSHTTPGRLPTLHFLLRSQRTWPHREKYPRLVAIPGCRVTRGEDDAPKLTIVDQRGVSCVAAQMDDLIFRGFELLLRRGPFPWSVRFPKGASDSDRPAASEFGRSQPLK